MSSPLLMYKAVQDRLISTFSYVDIILKIYLSIPPSNASAERSFNVLKRIKNYIRNSLSQEKLSDLSIIYEILYTIEKNRTIAVNYDELILQHKNPQKAHNITIFC